MSDTEQSSRAGSDFGPYRLKRLLGRGGMGEVYEAEHTTKEWTVAVKLMSPLFSQDPVFRKRMQREARTAGRLQEPHVVPIHEYGEIDGQLYLEMRLIEGTDLFSMLKRFGPLTPPRAVAIIRQVAAALDAAHAAGVMHRDVKPENILVTSDDFAYLVDFGIASATTDEKLTQMGTAVGTWKYMAPERFSKEEVTYRADIYALAAVLHECLTGVPPYRADSTSVLVAAHLMEPAPRPSQVRPGIPVAFDAVIARGMAKKPEDRYASAGDLALDAHRALSAPAQDQADNILRRGEESAGSGTNLAAMPPSPTPTPPPGWSQSQPTLTPPPGWSDSQPTPTPPPWSQSQPTPTPPPWSQSQPTPTPPPWSQSQPTPTPPPWSQSQPTPTPPPGWSQPEPEPKRRPVRKWIILAGAALVVVAVIVVVVTMTVLRPPPLRTLTSDDLDDILLNGGEVNSIMSAYDMLGSLMGREAIEPTFNVSPPDCLGVFWAGLAPVFFPSGYTALHYLKFQEPGNDPEHFVTEAAAVFPSADQASAFAASSAGNWKGCAGQTLTVTDKADSTKTQQWTVGPLTENAPGIEQKHTQVHSEKNGRPWVCDRALRAVSNVVIDVRACGYRISDEGDRIAEKIAGHVTK